MHANFRPFDRDSIADLLRMMAQLYQHDAIPWDEERARRAARGLLDAPEFGGIWLIQAGGAMAGYLVLTVCYSLEFHGRFGLLDEFFILPDWRGHGLGTQALAFVEEQCRERDLRALRLEVDIANLRAQELYRRSGFELHDRYLMTKTVSEPQP